MKTSLCLVVVSALGLLLPVGCSKENKAVAPAAQAEVWPELEQITTLTNEAQKMGYSVGLDHGQNLKQQFQTMTDVDLKALAYGFSDEMNGRARKFSNDEIGKNVEAMRRRINDKVVVPLDARKAGYAIGIDHAFNVVQQIQSLEVDLSAMAQGLSDEINGVPKKLSEAEIKEAMATVRRKMVDQMMAEGMKEKTSKKGPELAINLEASQKFLTENAQKEGVKTTASGLQYVVLTEGTGNHPTASDQVTVHYKGTLLDGKVFDSSYARSAPIAFGLGEVIKGWTEGVQLMAVGSKYKFFIPPALAYGEFGAPPNIPGNSALIFEVELLKIGP